MSRKFYCKDCAKSATGIAVAQGSWLLNCAGCGFCQSEAYEIIPIQAKDSERYKRGEGKK